MTMAEGDGNTTFTQAQVDEMLKGIKDKNAELLAEAKRTAAALKNYEGVDPEKYRQLEAAAAEAERKKAAAEGDFKSLEKQLIERHQGELSQRDTRIGQLSAALERRLIDADAAVAINEAKASVKGLLPHMRPHLKVVEVDGDFVAQVVDSKGNPRIADGKGTPMTIKDLVAEMKNDAELAPLFAGSGSSGGGAQRTAGATAAGGTVPATAEAFMANMKGLAKGDVKMAVP